MLATSTAVSILEATNSRKEGAEDRAGYDARADTDPHIAQREADDHANRHTDPEPEPYGDPCTRASVASHPSPPPRRVSHRGRRAP